MAEGDGAFYNEFYYELLRGNIDLDGDELKMVLVTGYTPDIDTHCVYADISGDEMSGDGYTAGGVALSGQSVTKDNVNNVGTFDATDPSWNGLDVGTPSHAILRDVTFDCLICYWEVVTLSAGIIYMLEFNAAGVLDLGS